MTRYPERIAGSIGPVVEMKCLSIRGSHGAETRKIVEVGTEKTTYHPLPCSSCFLDRVRQRMEPMQRLAVKGEARRN